jgi:hypothetical protein
MSGSVSPLAASSPAVAPLYVTEPASAPLGAWPAMTFSSVLFEWPGGARSLGSGGAAAAAGSGGSGAGRE